MGLKPGEVATGVRFFLMPHLQLAPSHLLRSLHSPFLNRSCSPIRQTTIMAVEFDGGVVLGADSRTSTGTYVANRVSDKLTALHHHIYCCRSGSAADTQALADYVRYFLASHAIDLGRTPAVYTAAKLMSTLIYRNKDNLLGEGWGEGGLEDSGASTAHISHLCRPKCLHPHFPPLFTFLFACGGTQRV